MNSISFSARDGQKMEILASCKEETKSKLQKLIKELAENNQSLIAQSFLPRTCALEHLFPLTDHALLMYSPHEDACDRITRGAVVVGSVAMEVLFLVPKCLITAPITQLAVVSQNRKLRQYLHEALGENPDAFLVQIEDKQYLAAKENSFFCVEGYTVLWNPSFTLQQV